MNARRLSIFIIFNLLLLQTSFSQDGKDAYYQAKEKVKLLENAFIQNDVNIIQAYLSQDFTFQNEKNEKAIQKLNSFSQHYSPISFVLTEFRKIGDLYYAKINLSFKDSSSYGLIKFTPETKFVEIILSIDKNSAQHIFDPPIRVKIMPEEQKEAKLIQDFYIFVPIEITYEDNTKSQKFWLIFDTGTTAELLIFNNYINLVEKTSLFTIGNLPIEKATPVSFSEPEAMSTFLKRRQEENLAFENRPIIGIVGYGILKNCITTLDYRKEKIYFNHLESTQNLVDLKKHITKTHYREDLNAIWFPVTINGNINGFAHLDSGYDKSWVQSTKVTESVKSYTIGEYDFMTDLPNFEFEPKDQSESYGDIKFNLIANIGNDFIKNYTVIINPKEKQIYFQR